MEDIHSRLTQVSAAENTLESHSKSAFPSKYLSFEPSLGVIQPMSNTSIVVTFSSEEPFEIDVIVPIEVTGGENKYISLKGRTQHINVCDTTY